MWSRQQDPFDPFSSFEDEDDERGRAMSPITAGTYSTATSKTSYTSDTRSRQGQQRQRRLERVKEEGGPRPLPPRLTVKLILHEEVSSTAVVDPDGESGSLAQLSIEGKVTARVESSNAKKNSPFCLQLSGPMVSVANITCKDHCVLEDGEDATFNTPFSRGDIGTVRCKVNIPKSEVAGCEIMSYSMNVRTQNMPILVQTKAAIKENETCRISVQVRSNLSNQGHLSDFTIIVAIPATLKGDTLIVTRGNHGVWDANKRLVTWKIGKLPHGESCLVSAEAGITTAVTKVLHDNPFDPKATDAKIACPVLVRCLSEVDQVSDLALSVMALDGVPATIVQHQLRSYRLLHRAGRAGGNKRIESVYQHPGKQVRLSQSYQSYR